MPTMTQQTHDQIEINKQSIEILTNNKALILIKNESFIIHISFIYLETSTIK